MLPLDKEIVSMSEDIKGYENVNSGQHQNSCKIPNSELRYNS